LDAVVCAQVPNLDVPIRTPRRNAEEVWQVQRRSDVRRVTSKFFKRLPAL
jgi:hypothetical protein